MFNLQFLYLLYQKYIIKSKDRPASKRPKQAVCRADK